MKILMIVCLFYSLGVWADPNPYMVAETTETVEIEFAVPVLDGIQLQSRLNLPRNYNGQKVVLILSGSGPNDVEFTSGPPTGPLFKMEQRAAEFLSAEKQNAVLRMGKRGVSLPRLGASKAEKKIDFNLHGTSTLTARVADAERLLQFVKNRLNPWLASQRLPKVDTSNLAIWGLSEGGSTAVLLALADQKSPQPRIKQLVLQAPALGSLIDIFRWQRVTYPAQQAWQNLSLNPNADIDEQAWPNTDAEWEAFSRYPLAGDFMPTTLADIKSYYGDLGLPFTFKDLSGNQTKMSISRFMEVLERQTWQPLMDPVNEVLAMVPVKPSSSTLRAWLEKGPLYFEKRVNRVFASVPPLVYRQKRSQFDSLKEFEHVSFEQYLHWALLGDIGLEFARFLEDVPVVVHHDRKDGNVPVFYAGRMKNLVRHNPLFQVCTHDLKDSFHRGALLNQVSIDGLGSASGFSDCNLTGR